MIDGTFLCYHAPLGANVLPYIVSGTPQLEAPLGVPDTCPTLFSPSHTGTPKRPDPK